MITVSKPSKIILYENKNKLTPAQIKSLLGCDYLINAGLYTMSTFEPVFHLKIDGKILATADWTLEGLGWNGLTFGMSRNIDNWENYITAVAMVKLGAALPLAYPSDMGGSHARTAFGVYEDGRVWMFAQQKPTLTIEQVQNIALAAGVKYAICLDGGGSTQGILSGGVLYSSRRVNNYICVWEDKAAISVPSHKIIETNWKWNGSLVRRNVTSYNILHHCSGYGTAQAIHNYHCSLGWVGIAYHYYVRLDGSIYRGRPEWANGGHSLNYNYKSIGICAEGNYNTDQMPEAQREAIRWLVADIRSRYPNIVEKKHSEVNQTECPGKNYPFEYIVGKTNISTDTNSAVKTDYIKEFQKWLNDNYNAGITADGIYGKQTKTAAVRAYQTYLNSVYKAGLVVDGSFGNKTKTVIRSVIRGQKDNSVFILQGLLYCNGVDCGGFDGVCGNGTYTAVKTYQKAKGLIEDGIAGAAVFESLLK